MFKSYTSTARKNLNSSPVGSKQELQRHGESFGQKWPLVWLGGEGEPALENLHLRHQGAHSGRHGQLLPLQLRVLAKEAIGTADVGSLLCSHPHLTGLLKAGEGHSGSGAGDSASHGKT